VEENGKVPYLGNFDAVIQLPIAKSNFDFLPQQIPHLDLLGMK